MLASGNPNVAFVAAIAAGALVAFVVGLFAVRPAGAVFIMVTLATAEMLYSWGFRSKAFNGTDEMGGVPRADLSAIGIDLHDPSIFALTAILVVVVVWLALEVVMSSADTARHPAESGSRGRARRPRLSLQARRVHGVRSNRRPCRALKVQHINFISPNLVSWFVWETY